MEAHSVGGETPSTEVLKFICKVFFFTDWKPQESPPSWEIKDSSSQFYCSLASN